MKCYNCNTEIEEDSLFCYECGARQDISGNRQKSGGFCQNCGKPLEPGAMFCGNCGQVVGQGGDSSNDLSWEDLEDDDYYDSDREEPDKKKFPFFLVITIVALVVLLGGGFGVYKLFTTDQKPKNQTEEQKDDDKEEEEESVAADVDATSGKVVTLDGTMEKRGDGSVILKWSDPISILADGVSEEELVEDVTRVFIDTVKLEEGVIDAVPLNQNVEVTGTIDVIADSIYLEAEAIYANGEKVEPKVEELDLSSEYIIPYSDSVLLTNADVEELSLQEINYAKNEIYARRGRRFKSRELQNYFDSKSWYNGTIAPENFKDSMLSSIEQKNAEFLSNLEFSISPKGYQLDQ